MKIRNILIAILVLIILIALAILLFSDIKEVKFTNREEWLESTPTEVPWEELDMELLEDNKASLFWEENVDFDDSVSGIRHRLDVAEIDGEWNIMWYGKQFECVRGENVGVWQKQLCP